MITEEYCSYEVAKLLKEKGFDVCTKSFYKVGDKVLHHNTCKLAYYVFPNKIPAPTLQMAMKWLREVHNLHCAVDYDYILEWYCQITSLKETVYDDYEEIKHYNPDGNHSFSSAEEAYEVAIRYCLENLI